MASPGTVVLLTDSFEIIVDVGHGFLIRQITHVPSQTKLLWERDLPVRSGVAPAAGLTALGPPGPMSVTTFDDRLLAGGWFVMVPSAGVPGTLDGQPTWMHGEAARLGWTVTEVQAARVEAEIYLPSSGLHVRRNVQVFADGVRTDTVVTNPGRRPVTCTYGEHPCFAEDVFAGATLEAPLRGSEAGSRGDPETFLDGIDTLPTNADGSHTHACLTVQRGAAVLRSDRGTVRMDWEADLLPNLVVWRHLQPEDSPIHGSVLAIEPMSAPGLGVDEAAPRDLTVLRPHGSRTWSLSMSWNARNPPDL